MTETREILEITEFERATANLPLALQKPLRQLPRPLTAGVQEIRLRAGQPLMLSTPGGEWMVTVKGEATKSARDSLMFCTPALLEECFRMLCDYSIHTHQQELRAGFVTAKNGCRAGLAGTAVTEGGRIVSLRDITSVCLRVARRHDGCAAALAALLTEGARVTSALLCGEPSSGKTSLLRDLAWQLASGARGRRFRVAVVDERGELSGGGFLPGCDVLKFCPKAEGIGLAVRCLAPDVVIFDEMGTSDEVRAVLEGLNSGVSAVATAHCRDRESLLRRPALAAALASGAFDRVAFLEGRRVPGSVSRVVETGDLLAKTGGADSGASGGNSGGIVCIGGAESARRLL